MTPSRLARPATKRPQKSYHTINEKNKLVFISCTECQSRNYRPEKKNKYIKNISMRNIFMKNSSTGNLSMGNFSASVNFSQGKLNFSECYRDILCSIGCNKNYTFKEATYKKFSSEAVKKDYSWFVDENKNTKQKKSYHTIDRERKQVFISCTECNLRRPRPRKPHISMGNFSSGNFCMGNFSNFSQGKSDCCYSDVLCLMGCDKTFTYTEVPTYKNPSSLALKKDTEQKKINLDQKTILIIGITIGIISTLILVFLWKKCPSSLINRRNRRRINEVRPFTIV